MKRLEVWLLEEKERVRKKSVVFLTILFMCTIMAGGAKAAIVADFVSNMHGAGGWPNSAFPDYANGVWLIYAQNDDQSAGKVLGADAWVHPVRPQDGLLRAYDWDGTTP